MAAQRVQPGMRAGSVPWVDKAVADGTAHAWSRYSALGFSAQGLPGGGRLPAGPVRLRQGRMNSQPPGVGTWPATGARLCRLQASQPGSSDG